jgi:dTDP-4-dehydrorhamnose 3,5-epimerase
MQPLATRLEGPILLEPQVHGDERGFFLETYRRSEYAKVGVSEEFLQDNHSRSGHGIVRGMHFSIGEGQAKLVRCARGSIWDALVDVRRGSPTFGQWEAHELDDQSHRQLYVPVGFAHGFCVTSEVADVIYKVSSYYSADSERGFRYDDPEVGVEWPVDDLIPSGRDANAPLLSEIGDELPFAYE